MPLVDPFGLYKNTHAMTLAVVNEKNTHAMTLVDPYVDCEKNTHVMTPVDPCVVSQEKTHFNDAGGSICGM